ncbi:hypothetical protein Tsubulata_049246 [Turnera subulata]|uniref:R13L1/DRL21-like LRR repeat region domain-containing protein n=1 Tax=Turnera subulata TaxID=218843 RepID=A0A9Q0F5V5_9ROSI|nr:hypothetical protein Tsubulata_049246 [Turnera subulata]
MYFGGEMEILDQLQPHPNLEYLEIHGYRAESFPDWGCKKLLAARKQWRLYEPSLSSFTIGNWEDVETFPEEASFLPHTLRSLTVSGLPNLKTLRLDHLPYLEELNLVSCGRLKSLPDSMPNIPLTTLRLSDCRTLESLPEKGLPSSLDVLHVSFCPLLEKRLQREKGEDWRHIIHISHQWPLSELPLKSFTIGTWKEVETFPEESSDTFLPPYLNSLTISGLPNLKTLRLNHLGYLRELDVRSCGRLKSLPDSMGYDLSFLTVLRLSDCRNLESLPEEGLPPALKVLHVSFCPLLEKRLQPEKGEDWRHILHIRFVTFTSSYSILPHNQLRQTTEGSFLVECCCDGFLTALAESMQDIEDLMMI